MKIPSDPYDFPITGEFDERRTALLIVDMQRDFLDSRGYMHARGDDMSASKSIIENIKVVRAAATQLGMTVIYTREGHRADLSDLPESKRRKTAHAGAEIGRAGPLGRLLVRGEPGWDFVRELQPRPSEIVVDKPGTGAFYGTDLHHILLNKHIENIVLSGVTTGVCVSSTAREASDRGFNVLVLSDCCAEPDPANHEIALRLLKIEGGYLAAVTTASGFLQAIGCEWIGTV